MNLLSLVEFINLNVCVTIMFRYYLRKMDMKICNRVMDERDMCVAELMDCDKANSMKNFTGRNQNISSQSVLNVSTVMNSILY